MTCLITELSREATRLHGADFGQRFLNSCREGLGRNEYIDTDLTTQMAEMNAFWRSRLETASDTTSARSCISIEPCLSNYLMLFRSVWLPCIIKCGLAD